VDPILCAADTLLQKGLEQEARDVLINLSDIAELEPALFKPNYANQTTKLLAAARNEEFDSETRQAALELVVCIVKAKPGLIRNNNALLVALCETLMGMVLDIEDTEEWHAAVEEQDLDDGAAPVVVIISWECCDSTQGSGQELDDSVAPWCSAGVRVTCSVACSSDCVSHWSTRDHSWDNRAASTEAQVTLLCGRAFERALSKGRVAPRLQFRLLQGRSWRSAPLQAGRA
jgi:hypothetical protein